MHGGRMPAARRAARTLVSVVWVALIVAGTAVGHAEDDELQDPGARPRVVGVATMNSFMQLTDRQARRDAERLTSRPDVDIVAWQEAGQFGDVYQRLRKRGWETHVWSRGARELAMSWRAEEFELVAASQHLMHRGARGRDVRFPFPGRYASVVTLAVRETGQHLSVLNTHVNQKIEHFEVRPGLPRRNLNARLARRHITKLAELLPALPGRYAVMAGDFNFDVRGDRRHRPKGFMADQLGSLARSSFAALGMRDLPLTHPVTGRSIDYVYLRRADLVADLVAFVAHRVLRGYLSDHRPVLARIRLA